MQQTFEDFLISTFMEDEPESVGDKDSFQDNFDRWLVALDTDLLIAYAEKWHTVRMLEHITEIYGKGT